MNFKEALQVLKCTVNKEMKACATSCNATQSFV